MSSDDLRDLLQGLPPSMDDPPDRFQSVQRLARRRARTMNVAVGGVVAAAVVAVAGALFATAPLAQPDSLDIATEPPSPTETVRYQDVGPLPGETTVVDLSATISFGATGTSTASLGPRPDGATAVKVSVVCLTAGRIVYPDGASIECDGPARESEIADPSSANYALIDLAEGQTSLKFWAGEDVGWKAVATYVRTETSEWGVNAKGKTFGVQRNGKSPDLIATYTTDGKQGYVYTKDLNGRWTVATSPADAMAQQEASEGSTRSIPVYESDGETVIGEFTSGP